MHDHPKLSCYTSPVLAFAISRWPFLARVHYGPTELDFHVAGYGDAAVIGARALEVFNVVDDSGVPDCRSAA